jgi:hypothetical protein
MRVRSLTLWAGLSALCATAEAAEFRPVFDFIRPVALNLEFELNGGAFFTDANGPYGVRVQEAGSATGSSAFQFATPAGITIGLVFLDVEGSEVLGEAFAGHVPGYREDNGAFAGYFDLAAVFDPSRSGLHGTIVEDTRDRFVFDGWANGWGGSAMGVFTWDVTLRLTATPVPEDCFSAYTSETFTFCVSPRGNLTSFQAPPGTEHVGHGGEGYVLCDVTSGAVYRDLGGFGEGGWLPATTSTPGALPFVVTRTSTDGIWTLRQVFRRRPAERQVQLSMRLTNNSAIARDVQLSRVFDANMDASTIGDRFDRTPDSVTAREVHGLMLTSAAGPVPHDTFVEPFAAVTGTSCAAESAAVPTEPGDWAGTLRHGTLRLGARRSQTIVVQYRGY